MLPAACTPRSASSPRSGSRQRTGAGSEITLALADVALAVAGHLGFLAEAQVSGAERPRIGNHLYGGLARDFRTSDGERVMVVALTRRHFADLAAVTGLTEHVRRAGAAADAPTSARTATGTGTAR